MGKHSGQKVPLNKEDGTFYIIKVLHSSETELGWSEENFEDGSSVIFPTGYGKDLCRVMGKASESAKKDYNEAFSIIRPASPEDLRRSKENQIKQEEAFEICRKKIEEHKLDMKLVAAHFLIEEPKILFLFTADNRVDFRELVKDLVNIFKTRIELRQIGVRDESRVIGGVGVCGRELCCHGLTDKLQPVSIKMAKEQNLSLNSMKISGPCGRLLCCLSYEYDFYSQEKQNYPPPNYRVKAGNEQLKVIEVNILSQRIRLVSADGRIFDISRSELFHSNGKWGVPESILDESDD